MASPCVALRSLIETDTFGFVRTCASFLENRMLEWKYSFSPS
jgi:hypothetical protein